MIADVIVPQPITGHETRRRKLHLRSRADEICRVQAGLTAFTGMVAFSNLSKRIAAERHRTRKTDERPAGVSGATYRSDGILLYNACSYLRLPYLFTELVIQRGFWDYRRLALNAVARRQHLIYVEDVDSIDYDMKQVVFSSLVSLAGSS